VANQVCRDLRQFTLGDCYWQPLYWLRWAISRFLVSFTDDIIHIRDAKRHYPVKSMSPMLCCPWQYRPFIVLCLSAALCMLWSLLLPPCPVCTELVFFQVQQLYYAIPCMFLLHILPHVAPTPWECAVDGPTWRFNMSIHFARIMYVHQRLTLQVSRRWGCSDDDERPYKLFGASSWKVRPKLLRLTHDCDPLYDVCSLEVRSSCWLWGGIPMYKLLHEVWLRPVLCISVKEQLHSTVLHLDTIVNLLLSIAESTTSFNPLAGKLNRSRVAVVR
jgi:hypothetical protein